MELYIKDVSKKDARLLVEWWNANTDDYYFLRKNVIGKLYSVYRQIK